MEMRNLLDHTRCSKFSPTFDNKECQHYSYAEDSQMKQLDNECGYCKLPTGYRCVADITRPIPLSHSSVGDFLTCHYGYYLKKVLGIEVRPPHLGIPLKAGKLWDTILQKHLGGNVNIKGVIDEYEIDEYTVAKVRALYHAYKELGIEVDPDGELQAKVDLTYDIDIPVNMFIPSVNVGDERVNLWKTREDLENETRKWRFLLKITGFYDRKYGNYFVENKLSSRPEFYLDPYFMASQCGTYFLGDPNLEYVIMEVVLFPQQKKLKGTQKRTEETPNEMYERIYGEILSRPSKYFLGFDKEKKRYGKKYHRSEFDLEAIKQRYQQIVLEILSCQWSGNFYKNEKVCNNILPGISCSLINICRNNNISENIYCIRGK